MLEKLFKKKVKKFEWSLPTLSALSMTSGAFLIVFNFFFFSSIPQVYAIVNLMAVVVIVAIPLIYKYNDYTKIKVIEEMFPKYLRDVSENISTGMTLPQAMRTASKNDYGSLTPFVKSLSAKVDWGISFEKSLDDFAKKTGSKTMKRNIQTIIEAHRSGGKVDTILDSVAGSLQELEKIKKERSASVYSQMINGYMIYVIFLGVMIGMSTILVPAFTKFGNAPADLKDSFTQLFSSLTVIQGIFAGLAIGKMAEGTLVAGVKHSLALVIFGYSMFLIFA